MNFEKNIVFVASEFESGSGVYVPDYQIVITSNNVVKNLPFAVIKHKSFGKIKVKTIFSDELTNLAFLESPEIQDVVKIDFNVETFLNENSALKIFYTNYYNDTLIKYAIFNGYQYFNELKLPFFETFLTQQTNGGLVINALNEVMGISIRQKSTKQQFFIPSKIVKSVLEEFKLTGFDHAIRCPYCKKIIDRYAITEGICPNCQTELKPATLGIYQGSKTETTELIEEIIIELGNDVDLSTINANFWEIQHGSATIFIRYDPEIELLTAFSIIAKLEKNKEKVLDFILTENKKLDYLSFAVDNDRIFLVSNYIYKEDFTKELGYEIFSQLAEKADYYDDIIIKMQQE